MFLNSGVSAIWNHDHEFSTRTQLPSSTSIPRRSPLARSAFSTPPPRKPTLYENSIIADHPNDRPSSADIPRTKETVVRFQELEPETMSEDGRSIANSDCSEATATGGKRRRRSIRTSVTWQLAHPAPTLTQKQRLLQIRPKLLLQLQRLSPGSRPKPTLDILPSTTVVPRLATRFPRMFRGKCELGTNDVIIVKSEDYDTGSEANTEDNESDDDGIASRDLVAVICQARKDLGGSQGKAEIVLSDGSLWTANPLPSGMHEFITTDERGNTTTARWVRRSTKRMSVDVSDMANISNEVKFTFSIIDPNTRRHPIMASLTQSKLEIPDTFTSVSPSAGKHPPTSSIPQTSEDEDAALPERTTHVIDENLKTLIQVTATWVALRQGWSPYFKYNDAIALSNSQVSSAGRARASSLTPEPTRPNIAGTSSSTPESSHSTLSTVLSNKIRRTSMKASHPVTNAVPSQSDRFSVPKRSLSNGTAFVQRAAAARRAGNPPSTVASDSEGESAMGASVTQLENSNTAYKRMSTPPALSLPGSSTTTPETPTRPPRRAQSAYIPTSALQNGFTNESSGMDGSQSPSKQSMEVMGKVKVGRWKAFTNFFRRRHCTSSS